MTSSKPRKQLALSKELVNPPRPDGEFEDIPKIPQVAGNSTAPYVRDWETAMDTPNETQADCSQLLGE